MAVTAIATKPKPTWDRARFYPIDGKQYVSVTTFLGIVDKSGPLMHWAANEERRAFETAILDVLTRPLAASPDEILAAVSKAVSGAKAAHKQNEKAKNIGSGTHALIEWETRRRMGTDPGKRPAVPDESELGFMAWQDWAKGVGFKPMVCERTVVSRRHGYAGTLDTLAIVSGVLTVVDYKTGKAVYPEAYLQNTAYRAALMEEPPYATATPAGLILRLPKTLDDPEFEAAPVPATKMSDVLAALTLWRWSRRMAGLMTGDTGREGA